MPTNFIKRIGLEMEGGWNRRPLCEVIRDGSVDVRAEIVGEVCSPPYHKPENAEAWIRKHHPTVVNQSCGFHIHVSVEAGLYMRLMTREFYGYFIEAYRVWGNTAFQIAVTDNAARFWERMTGRNRYCTDQWEPDRQATVVNRQSNTWDTRYAHLNFCWARHGTLESRLLPMFSDPTLTVSGMHKFLDIVNTWLEQSLQRPEDDLSTAVAEDAELNLGPEVIRIPDLIGVTMAEPPPVAIDGEVTDYQRFLRELMPSVWNTPPEPARASSWEEAADSVRQAARPPRPRSNPIRPANEWVLTDPMSSNTDD